MSQPRLPGAAEALGRDPQKQQVISIEKSHDFQQKGSGISFVVAVEVV